LGDEDFLLLNCVGMISDVWNILTYGLKGVSDHH